MNKFDFIKEKWGWEPHPSQREFMGFEAKIKVAACGRRWGKTEAMAYDIAYYFLTRENYTQMIVSPTYDQSRLIFRTCENLLYNMPKIEIRKTPFPYIKYKNNLISARTADNDGAGLRGNKSDRIVIDEAAFVKDNVVYEVISPMLADTNGELVLISTPFGRNHFYDFFNRGLEKTKDCASFTYPSISNPHINAEYIEKQRANMSQSSFETEYEAKFCDNVSNVFKESSIIKAINNSLSGVGEFVIGVDFARYSDYTVAVVLRTNGDFCEMVDMIRFNKVSWDREKQLVLDLIQKYNPIKIVCDATGVGDPICEDLERKIYERNINCDFIKFRFTNESKNMIIDYLNLLLDSEKIKLLDNSVLIEEMKNFEYILTENGNIKLEARFNHHDDCVCALALATYGAKDLGGIITFNFC